MPHTLRGGLIALLLLMVAPLAWANEAYYVITPKPDVTVSASATLIAAQNDFRVALSCTNHDSGVAVRWGDSTVTAAQGQRVPAGTAIEIRDRGAVYMISESTDVTVSCTEEAR